MYIVFTILYLPVSAYLIKDFNDYSEQPEYHQYRVSI